MPSRAPHPSRILLAIAVAAGSLITLSCELPTELDEPGPTGPAATCFDYSQQLRITGSLPIDYGRDVALIRDHAFVAGNRLTIIELNPVGGVSGMEETSIRATHVASAGNVLCFTGYATLSTLAVTPAGRGKVMGSLSLPFSIQDIAADSRYAYLLSTWGGLWIADIGDPAAPRIVGSVDIPNGPMSPPATALAIQGNLACVITHQDLWVIDISNRNSPQRVGHLPLEYRTDVVAMVGQFAVVSAGARITVVDIGNPTAPTAVLTIDDLAQMFVENIVFEGTRAYLCGDDVVIVDLTRPASPVVTDRLTEVNVNSIAVAGDRICLVGFDNFRVAKLASARRPAPLFWVNAQGDAFRTALRPPIACVAGGFRGLWVMAIEGTPGVLGRMDFLGLVNDVVLDSTYAFVAAGENGLVVVEAGLSLPPRMVAELELPGESRAIVLDGKLAYLAQADLGLWIADVSDPLSPRVVGSLDTAGALDLVVRDGRAWIADQGFGLVVADVTDPERPRFSAGIAIPTARALTLDGDYAYVVSEDGRLQVVDVSTPDAPKLAGQLEMSSVMRDVAIDGHYAYLATEMGLMVADVSDPMAPALVGMACGGVTAGVLIDKASDRVFVANGNLTVIRRQCDDSSRGVWQ